MSLLEASDSIIFLTYMEQTIHFKTKNYFEGIIYGLGWAFAILTPMLLFTHWYLTPIFGFLAFLILTAQYKVTIDFETREIDEYLFIVGMKTQNERSHFSQIDHIYITRSRYAQQLNYKSISSTVEGTMYNAFLKTDEANIFLGERKDIVDLKNKIKPLAEQLKLEIRDP